MWVRGLKLGIIKRSTMYLLVAPHVGAWIETYYKAGSPVKDIGRTPCGCVD